MTQSGARGEKEVQGKEEREMQKTGCGGNGIPTGVGEQPRVRLRYFDLDGYRFHFWNLVWRIRML